MARKPIKIIGGGFSGLVTAYALIKHGYIVELHEKQSQVGGLLSSQRIAGNPAVLVESAANGIVASKNVQVLASDLNLELLRARKESKKRFFFDGKYLRQWPLSVTETLLTIFTFFKSLASRKPHSGETLYEWGLKHVGVSATENLLSTAFTGIYGARSEELSATLVLAKFFDKDFITQKSHEYKGTVSFKDGMSTLTSALRSFIEKSGSHIILNSNYTSQNLKNDLNSITIVMAASMHDSANLISEVAPALSEQMLSLKTRGLVSVTCVFPKSAQTKIGFGCLFTKKSRMAALGVLWNNQIFPYRASDAECSETWIYDENYLNYSEAQFVEDILKSRKVAFKSADHKPLNVCIHKWPSALPLYSKDLERFLNEKPFEDLKNSKLYFIGNYLGTIGLSQILERALKLASEITIKDT